MPAQRDKAGDEAGLYRVLGAIENDRGRGHGFGGECRCCVHCGDDRQELQIAVPVRQAIVRIETADGRSRSHRTYVVRGTARNPMDAKEVEAKALDLMAPVLGAGRANELIAAVGDLERIEPISRLRRLLQA
jgi:hypothetical protein